MARIRSVRPEFWTRKKLALASPVVRLVMLGLVSMADDDGRLEADPVMLRALLFPLGGVDDAEVEAALAALAAAGEILRYDAGGEHYAELLGWRDEASWQYQVLSRPSKSRLPSPPQAPTHGVLPESSVSPPGVLPEPSGSAPRVLTEPSASPPVQVMEPSMSPPCRSGGEVERRGTPPSPPPGGTAPKAPPEPPTAAQVAGARAVIGVLRNGRDVAPDRRKDAADLAAKLDAGTATAADVESFAARHAHDDACRIANASAHKQNRADERDRRRAKRSNGSEPAAAAAPPSSPPPGPAEHEAEIATTWRRLESLGAKRDGVTEDDVRRLVLGLRRLDAAAETRTDQVRSLVLAPHDRRDAGWYRDARKLLAAAEVLPAAAPTQVAPPRIDPVTRAAIDATALKLKGLATRRRVEDALCGLEQIRTGPSAARAAELRAVELRSRDTHWFGLVEAFVRAQDAGQDRPDRAALRRIQAIAEGKGPPSVIESARAYLRTQNGEGAADPVDMLDSLERRLASQHETVGAGEAA